MRIHFEIDDKELEPIMAKAMNLTLKETGILRFVRECVAKQFRAWMIENRSLDTQVAAIKHQLEANFQLMLDTRKRLSKVERR